MNDAFPPVSALCVTYGRPHLVEETIYSFLLQDYPGEKELLILNDCAEQTLVIDHPEITVINLPSRFRSLGEKRNASVGLAKHNHLFVWDDDDIYLPHRLSLSMQHMMQGAEFFKQGTTSLVLDHNEVYIAAGSDFHAASCCTRELFHRVGGYQPLNSGEDHFFELAVQEQLGDRFPHDLIDMDEFFYLYRWGGTDSYHASWFDPTEAISGHQRVADYVKEKIAAAQIATGRIELIPRWRNDYVALSDQFIRAQIASSDSTLA